MCSLVPQFASELHQSIARGHVQFKELTSGRAASIIEIAAREGVTDRFVSIVLDFAFLSPSVVEATVDGRYNPDISANKMMFDAAILLRWSES